MFLLFSLAGCLTGGIWSDVSGRKNLSLYSTSHISGAGHEYDLSGDDIHISNIDDRFLTIHWNAEVNTEKFNGLYNGLYACTADSEYYGGPLNGVVCQKKDLTKKQ